MADEAQRSTETLTNTEIAWILDEYPTTNVTELASTPPYLARALYSDLLDYSPEWKTHRNLAEAVVTKVENLQPVERDDYKWFRSLSDVPPSLEVLLKAENSEPSKLGLLAQEFANGPLPHNRRVANILNEVVAYKKRLVYSLSDTWNPSHKYHLMFIPNLFLLMVGPQVYQPKMLLERSRQEKGSDLVTFFEEWVTVR